MELRRDCARLRSKRARAEWSNPPPQRDDTIQNEFTAAMRSTNPASLRSRNPNGYANGNLNSNHPGNAWRAPPPGTNGGTPGTGSRNGRRPGNAWRAQKLPCGHATFLASDLDSRRRLTPSNAQSAASPQ